MIIRSIQGSWFELSFLVRATILGSSRDSGLEPCSNIFVWGSSLARAKFMGLGLARANNIGSSLARAAFLGSSQGALLEPIILARPKIAGSNRDAICIALEIRVGGGWGEIVNGIGVSGWAG